MNLARRDPKSSENIQMRSGFFIFPHLTSQFRKNRNRFGSGFSRLTASYGIKRHAGLFCKEHLEAAKKGISLNLGWVGRNRGDLIKRVSAIEGRWEPAPMMKPGRTSGAGLRTMIY
jgi:hypothetical protein